MNYTEQLAVQEAARRPTEYISQADYRRQKAALTRAKNSGSPKAVLATVEKTLGEWRGKAWPDDWNLWRIALEDAAWEARQQGFGVLSNELHAAALVLFP